VCAFSEDLKISINAYRAEVSSRDSDGRSTRGASAIGRVVIDEWSRITKDLIDIRGLAPHGHN